MRVKGPRLRTRLLLASTVLLVLPLLGYQYLQQTRQFLYRGQERAQSLAAQAVATALHERWDLFIPEDPVQQAGSREAGVFYAYPLTGDIQIDGYGSDWGDVLSGAARFAGGDEGAGDGAGAAFSLVWGIRDEGLYFFLRVHDDRVVYRHPGLPRLDAGDHVRLTLEDAGGRRQRLLIGTDGPGAVTAYRMRPGWGRARDDVPVRGLTGHWQPLVDGYDLELRLPLQMLGKARRLRLAVADVDDEVQRQVRAIADTLPGRPPEELNSVVVRSRALEGILDGLERSGARIWIVDGHGRVRAEAGSLHGPVGSDLPVETALRRERSVRLALQGTPAVERRRSLDGEGEIIMATWPVESGDGVLGAVVVEQDTGDILALQRRSLERIALLTAGAVALVVVMLMLFASRLAWRIRRLSREADGVIDARGRLARDRIQADSGAADEIGDLSRAITALLRRLGRYTRFLENMPRMLRHEINNPLNTISTSLQNLAGESPRLAHSAYMHSARRGIDRIGVIVNALTEAANLEEALRAEEREPLDLGPLVRAYAGHCRVQYPALRFELDIQGGPCRVLASDFRMEQVLDKLIDNAVDFTTDGGVITLRLGCDPGGVELSVRNDGPPLPPDLDGALFESLVTGRKGAGHFGMGLHVVRTIAEHHGGTATARNREDGQGVEVTVRLPVA